MGEVEANSKITLPRSKCWFKKFWRNSLPSQAPNQVWKLIKDILRYRRMPKVFLWCTLSLEAAGGCDPAKQENKWRASPGKQIQGGRAEQRSPRKTESSNDTWGLQENSWLERVDALGRLYNSSSGKKWGYLFRKLNTGEENEQLLNQGKTKR